MNAHSRPLVLLSLLAAALFAGCGDDSNDNTTGGTPPDTSPPAVTSVNSVDANHLEVVFSEGVQRTSAEAITNYTIREVATPLVAGDAAAPGDSLLIGGASLGSDSRTVTLSLIDPMSGINYQLTVRNVADASGNKISSPVATLFTGTSDPDVTPPQLVSRTPAPGATGVAVMQSVLFQFSEPVNYSTVVGGASWTDTNPVSFSIQNDNAIIFALTPDSPLSLGTQYTVSLDGVQDLAGNSMPNTSWTFTTTNTADTTPPTVVSTTPANGATNVNVNANLMVTFSEAVNQLTVMPTVVPDPGDGTATWSNGGKTVTFDPDVPLLSNQAYTVTFLPHSFEDLAGNGNTQIKVVVFSTGATLPAGSFTGTLAGDPGTAAADPTGAVVVAGSQFIFTSGDDFNILGMDVAASNDTYDITHLSNRVYYPLAVKDTNGDNELDPETGDAVGLYGIDIGMGDFEPDSVVISSGNRVTGVNFPLYDFSAVTGHVTYSGAGSSGFYDIYIGLFSTAGFDPNNDPDYATYAYWPYETDFIFSGLDDGIADGMYYVGAYLDLNGNFQYDPGVDPAGFYGGLPNPTPLNLQNGNDVLNITIPLLDPVARSVVATTGVTWPKPAHHAPWLSKLSKAIRESQARQ